MYIKIIVPKENQDKLKGCYINADKIIDICYDKISGVYLASINDTLRYRISKEDYEKLIKSK